MCVCLCSFQGLGLYAARDIEKNTMVIEYIGSVIRNEVAERKEKMYESQVRIYTNAYTHSSCHAMPYSNISSSLVCAL